MSRGFGPASYPTEPLVSYQTYRQLSEWILPPLANRAIGAHVESRKGAVAAAMAASLRFPSPLIKPDVRFARIRLSDWLHCKAHGGALRWPRRSRRTPSAPKIASAGKRLVPRDDTL